MLIGRCKSCGSTDLQLYKSSLVCSGCGKELRFYQIEFVVVDGIMRGEPFRHDDPETTLQHKLPLMESV